MKTLFTLISILQGLDAKAVYGITKFSHMSREEFSKNHGLKPNNYAPTYNTSVVAVI